MHVLYPMIKPYATHALAVESPHVLYVEESGNPAGLPVVVLHGGPGLGCCSFFRRIFNPEIFRIILFDQRGCGRSIPYLEEKGNTTQALLEDIDTILTFLGLEQVTLFADGWGAFLAMMYAGDHSEKIKQLILFRSFLAREEDIKWLYDKGANALYPEAFEDFIRPIPEYATYNDILTYYYECVRGNNEIARMSAAKQWMNWYNAQTIDPHTALACTVLQTLYCQHRFFVKNEIIFDKIPSLQHLPISFIHGRYDVVYPLGGVYSLHQLLPQSQLNIIREGGHSEMDTGMTDALMDVVHHLSF